MRLLLIFLVISSAMIAACGGRQTVPAAATASTEDASANTAENLFAIQCAQCHQLDEVVNGPALRGTLANWGGDRERYKAFIKNSQAVIASGDTYALQLFNQWGKMVMPAQKLTDAELDALVDYLNP